MTRIGYHCSHEQYAPSALLKLVRLAAEAGFQSAMCSLSSSPLPGAIQKRPGYISASVAAA